MKRSTLLLMLASAPALSGCVPMMAASAVSMVAEGARGTPVSNEGLGSQLGTNARARLRNMEPST